MRRLNREESTCGILSAVDPRIRLLAAGLLLALVVSSECGSFPWLVAGTCLATAILSGMTLRMLFLRLLHPLFITAMILALKIFMGAGKPQLLFSIGGLSLISHQDGLHEGLLIASRIMGAVSVAMLLSQMMTFTETMAALAWMRIPRGFVDVSLFAWRSLFMLYDGAGIVYTAQKNRLGYCGLRRSLRSFGSMAGMLTIRALDGSQSMTTAMTQRGYDGTLPLLRYSRLSAVQFIGLLVFALAVTATWKLQN
ncbi:MAG: cobalt ECF transporter T component CbiQ [Desulfuromonadales bacterium]|nr:cobalt ECF transporter T component CbiQ [Desulfuromonadales bacterium]